MEAFINTLHNECLLELNGSLNENGPDLYHYTSLESCKNILENKTFRYTDIRYLNDPSELENGLKIWVSVLSEFADQYRSTDSKFSLFLTYIKHNIMIMTSLHSEKEEKINDFSLELKQEFQRDQPHPPNDIKIFIACFSEKPDDLRQWIPYGNDGNGASIGIQGCKNGLHNICDRGIVKVCYEPEQKKVEFLTNFINGLYKAYKEGNINPSDIMSNQVFYNLLIVDILACKTEKYSDEQEWRLFHVTSGTSEEIKYYENHGIIKPYIDISFEPNCVQEIIIGPKTEKRLNTESMRALLRNNGYKETVKKSDITYR